MAIADTAIAVAHHDQGGKAEAPAAFHDLGDTVDVHQLVDQIAVAIFLVPATATTTFTALASAFLGIPLLSFACHVSDSLQSLTASPQPWTRPYAVATDPLELEPAFTGRVCERLHAPMIDVAATVEHHLLDTLCEAALGDFLADAGSRRHVPGLGFLAVRLVCGGGRHGDRVSVVDHLGIDVLARTENRQARTRAMGGEPVTIARLALLEDVLGHYFFLPSLRRT